MNAIPVNIELRRHVGSIRKEGIDLEVEHPQWIVMASIKDNPLKQVGYIGHKLGGFMPLSHVHDKYGRILAESIASAAVAARDAKLAEPEQPEAKSSKGK